MRKRGARGCGCDEEEPLFAPDLTVYEDDDWIDTGLLDQHGERIVRTEKGPLGYELSPR